MNEETEQVLKIVWEGTLEDTQAKSAISYRVWVHTRPVSISSDPSGKFWSLLVERGLPESLDGKSGWKRVMAWEGATPDGRLAPNPEYDRACQAAAIFCASFD